MRGLAAAMLLGAAAADAPISPPTAFTVPAADYRLVEGIAGAGDTLWLSSVTNRSILARRGGRITEFRLPDGKGAPLGIAWDSGRGRLWIAAHCPADAAPQGCTGAGLLAMDRRGRITAQLVPGNGKSFAPGDVSVWRDQVFVSDTANGAVYRCRGRCEALETLIAPREGGGSAQGSAVFAGGARLLVADYGRGLIAVDLASGAETPVPLPDGKPLQGIDGLIAVPEGFVAVANARSPGQLLAFRISAANRITDLRIRAKGGAIGDPTQLTRIGKTVWIVADSRWGVPQEDTRPTRIATIPLE